MLHIDAISIINKMIVEMGFNVLMIIKITLMIIELMIVEMVIIFLMMSHHHQINDAVIIKLMIVEKGLKTTKFLKTAPRPFFS